MTALFPASIVTGRTHAASLTIDEEAVRDRVLARVTITTLEVYWKSCLGGSNKSELLADHEYLCFDHYLWGNISIFLNAENNFHIIFVRMFGVGLMATESAISAHVVEPL